MDKTQEVLSSVVTYNKYSRHISSLGRRETWKEITLRYLDMLSTKYPQLSDEIYKNGESIIEKKVLMSMRAAQFSGRAIEKNNSRVYNCAYLPIDHPTAFSEVMFLLLGGTGVGYSVQFSHIEQLPEINKGNKEHKFLVSDSIEGWSDSIKALMYWGFGRRKAKPRFDFSDIREKGERLVTAGGKAPGPEPLKECLFKIEQIFDRKVNGSKLTSLEVHDIICHIAHSVLAGGIRRAALISLFSADDTDMATCKSGNWWELNGQRGRANNSAVLLRHRVTKEFFLDLWKTIENSGSGEPGIYFSNDTNWGTNPCCEIALRAFSFCNLTEINAGSILESALIYPDTRLGDAHLELVMQEELNNRARVASFFGTLQAGITDFHYLRPIWKSTTEKDALIGVGITGICNGDILGLDLTEASSIVKEENERVSKLIGINKAARTTCIKPSGTTSCVVGTSSGIHAWHSKYYIRNMQCSVGDDLYNFFIEHHPSLIKVMDYDKKSAVIGIPQKAPDTAILREDENAVTMLERVFKFYDEWVKPGHRSGNNTNNVSATVSIDKNSKYIHYEDKYAINAEYWDEWAEVGEMLWENRHKFNGMSVLPYDGGTYKDAPFQEITEKEYLERIKLLDNGIDLTLIKEYEDNTNLISETACSSGGACDLQY